MCGIAGIIGAQACDKETLENMGKAIFHRGPDDFGTWIEERSDIGFVHQRLSILDLSPAGHQPMLSGSGRYSIAYNGEIYNHLELRKKLNIDSWRGHSDTETILAGFDHWGIKETIDQSIGMFAIAVWDLHEQELTLIRDRAGEKPLYYGWQGEGNRKAFIFGSELKVFKQHPSFQNNINRKSISLLLRHNCIPAPNSIFEDVFKLPSGCMLKVSHKNNTPEIKEYWSASEVANNGSANLINADSKDVIDELESLLSGVVKQQMISDVPLGAFLSGGLDSTTIVSLMQKQSEKPVKTFTIGFEEKIYNEAAHAKTIAEHLGTDHTELYVSPEQAMEVISRLPSIYDEPFSDSSQIPTILVAELARQKVTVSLSGDAGDELFCGYNRYLLTEGIWKRFSTLPIFLRKGLASLIKTASPQTLNTIFGALSPLLPKSFRQANYGDKLHKAAGVIGLKDTDELYLGLVSHWNNPEKVVLGDSSEPGTLITSNMPNIDNLDSVQRMMALDLMTYLPDDILVKVDRAAMSCSLESRVPFLDHRVIEYAWKLPQSFKLRDGQTKWILRQILYRHVPQELFDRPKVGFGIPLDSWLRGALKGWAEDLLAPDVLKSEGFFDTKAVRKKWDEHISGKYNWSYHLWDILMFQSWLRENR